MNPMAQQSFDSGGSSKVLKRQDSRVAQAVMAAVACGGKSELVLPNLKKDGPPVADLDRPLLCKVRTVLQL